MESNFLLLPYIWFLVWKKSEVRSSRPLQHIYVFLWFGKSTCETVRALQGGDHRCFGASCCWALCPTKHSGSLEKVLDASWESYEEGRCSHGIMVPFQEVLSKVRRVLQEVNPNLLPSLLTQLVEAQIFSAQYYQSFFVENLSNVDVDDLARRLALPIWAKWEASKVILSSVLMENESNVHGMILL